VVELDERVKGETATLRAIFRANGLERLTDEVRARTLEAASLDYRLEDSGGRFLAGNLPSPRARDGKYSEGWVQLAEPGSGPVADAEAEWERPRHDA
jgi:hypothetical protein